jgi:hypothetical protein
MLIAQNSFQRGSFIDKKGVKNEGFIYNLDWQDNPLAIEFRSTLEGASTEIKIEDIQEFEILGTCKYIKYDGLIDVSSGKLGELDFNRNPNWKQASVLLKVLVESDASLYLYNSSGYSRFFYNVKSKDVKTQQLVFKEFYLDGSKTQIGTNFQFRQQLANDLVCGTNKTALSKLVYDRRDLIKYFVDFNNCSGKFVNFDKAFPKTKNKVQINYSFLIGASTVNFATKSSNNYTNVNQLHEFDTEYSIPIGAEIEVVLPINNNKWAFYFQPAYQIFTAEEVVEGLYSSLLYKIDYKALTLPLGLRHYFFLRNDNKIYLDGAVGLNFDIGSKVILGNDVNFSFFTAPISLNLGLGYVLKNRYSLGVRYNYCADVIQEGAFQSSFTGIGCVFKYKIN